METENSLRCPLCLKQFHQPRLLDQCMHSFCSVCICSYVRPLLSTDKAIKKIPCPVCKTIFQGPSSSSELINWVEQLPSDSLLNNYLDHDSGEKQLNCEPCSVRGKRAKARKFCKECTEKLCEQCADVHMSFKGTRTHTLAEIDGTSGSELIVEPLPICEYHEKKGVEYYCKDHDELICSKCAVLKHRVCDIVEIDTATESLLNVCSVESIRSSFLSLKTDLGDANITVQEKNERFRTEVHDVLLDVEYKRKKVNAAFDRLKENIAVEIKQHLNHAKEFKNDKDRIATGIDNSLALLDTAEKKGKYIQMFLRGKAMTRQIDGTRKRIKDCKEKCTSARFEYSFSPNVTAIINNMSALGKFSVVVTEANAGACMRTDSSVAVCTDHTEYIEEDNLVKSSKSKQIGAINEERKTLEVGAVGTVKSKSDKELSGHTKLCIWGVVTSSKGKENTHKAVDIDLRRNASTLNATKEMNVRTWGVNVESEMQNNVRVKTTKKVKIALPDGSKPHFGGAAYLEGDKVVLTDVKYYRLLLLDNNLNFVSELEIDRQPRKVTAVSKDEVAVGLYKDHRILIIKVGKEMTINKILYTKSFTKCVTGCNNRLFLSAHDPSSEAVWRMTCLDLEDDEEMEVETIHDLVDGAHMAVFNRNNKNFIVYSCRGQNCLKCITSDGEDVFSCPIQGPVGFDIDNFGNIFVASCVRHKIYHLTTKGHMVKALEAGYMSKPYEVRMNTTGDKLLVTQYENSEIHILGLSYK